jgi:hypothetical protein
MMIASYLILSIMGVTVKERVYDFDEVSYEHYLGKDYRETYKAPAGIVPTIACNHVSCFDA